MKPQVRNGIVQSPSRTRRVEVEAGSNTFPAVLTFEVTKDVSDDGIPEYTVELISGDVEALSDLENEEAGLEAIRVAEAEWAKLEGAA